MKVNVVLLIAAIFLAALTFGSELMAPLVDAEAVADILVPRLGVPKAQLMDELPTDEVAPIPWRMAIIKSSPLTLMAILLAIRLFLEKRPAVGGTHANWDVVLLIAAMLLGVCAFGVEFELPWVDVEPLAGSLAPRLGVPEARLVNDLSIPVRTIQWRMAIMNSGPLALIATLLAVRLLLGVFGIRRGHHESAGEAR